jgi:hypothetical protein
MTLVAVAALVGVALAGRLAGKSWLSPGAFFSVFWAGIVLLGAIGAPDYETPWIGPAWIALACAAFSAGCFLGDFRRGDEPPPEPIARPDPALAGMPIAIAGCFAMGLVYLIARVVILGPVWSFDEDAPDLPEPYQLLLAAHYGGPAFGGLYFASGRRRARLLSITTLIPPALMALVYVRRSSLLMSGMFWLGGLFTASARAHDGPVRLVTARRLLIWGLIASTLAGVAVLFQMFRLQLDGTEASVADTASSYMDAIGSDNLDEAWTRVRVILFGYVAPFSHWMARAWDSPPPLTWGAWTFAGPYRLLGLGERVRIDDFELQSGALSNLYTAFYGLARDFSPLGALAAMFAFGFVAGSAYRLVTRGRTLAIPVLVGVYATTIFSPIWPLFRYNALIFGLVYVAMFFARHGWPDNADGMP